MSGQQGEREALAQALYEWDWPHNLWLPEAQYIDYYGSLERGYRKVYLARADIALAWFAAQPTVQQVRESVPQIICLCGSTRFYDEFQQANYDLTMAGKIVLSVGFYPHSLAKAGHGEGVGHNSVEKVALDELHKRKIDLADRVLVLNVGGYIGSSTRGEIDYALAHGVPVDYLEPVSARIARSEKGGE